MVTRRSAYENGGTFENDDLLWYAKGVRALQERDSDPNDPTSWSFLAAIHGIAGTPTDPVDGRYWDQCQHSTWYFLPWHRGYLLSLERILQDVIISEGGPDDWALPYWNYSDKSNPNARDLPPAFTTPTMPDGTPNPLHVEERFGELPLQEDDVDLELALTETVFTGTATGDPGFGGADTGFNHLGGDQAFPGELEDFPHNVIHGAVGGIRLNPPTLGLMSDPNTAALDPIFYLHHSNIDRLWEVWLNRDSNNENPIDSAWLEGPGGFVMPTPYGDAREFTPSDVESTEELGYRYDDISDPLEGLSARDARLQRLGRQPSWSHNPMGKKRRAELIGANSSQITLLGTSASTQVQLDRQVMQRARNSFAAFEASDPDVDQPDRIYLNLENIRCDVDGQIIDIYINLPSGADPDQHPELRARPTALFGAAKASDPNQPHGGMGVTKVINITRIVDALHLDGTLDNLSDIEVTLRPRFPVTQAENVTVERISVYRQGY